MLNLMTAVKKPGMLIQRAFLSLVTRLSIDPPHMLDLRDNDPQPPRHTITTLTFPETYTPAIRRGDPVEIPHNTTVILMVDSTMHTLEKIFLECFTLTGIHAMYRYRLNLQYALLQSNKNSLVELSYAFIDIL